MKKEMLEFCSLEFGMFDGRSLTSRARKAGAAGEPTVGPAKTALGFCVAKFIVPVHAPPVEEKFTGVENTADGTASASELMPPAAVPRSNTSYGRPFSI